MTEITVRVNTGLVLKAGFVSKAYDERYSREVWLITPPTTSMFDQVVSYLNAQPEPPYERVNDAHISIGLVALAIRWGSYLATLLDGDAPLHSTIPTGKRASQPEDISYLNDDEMKRLNLEISCNLARLGDISNQSSSAYEDLLLRAYHYLPMPFRSTKADQELENGIANTYSRMSAVLHVRQFPEALPKMIDLDILWPDFDAEAIQIRDVEESQASRVLANYLARCAWRNSAIEDYHAGGVVDLQPHQRRFSHTDERRLLKDLCSKVSAISLLMLVLYDPKLNIAARPFYARYPNSAKALYNSLGFYSYPRDWSLTDFSSDVKL